MKAAETKTTTATQNLQAKGGEQQPFFQQQEEQQGSFFGNEPPAAKPFFTPFIQTKLTIGQPGDQYEQEADAMAEQVVQRMADRDQLAGGSSAVGSGAQVQRKCAECAAEEQEEAIAPKLQMKSIFESNEDPVGGQVQRKCEACAAEQIHPMRIQRMGEEEEPELQAKGTVPGLQASPDLESRLNATKGSGSPLPDETRSSMESAFGTDFSGVRVHTNSGAVQMNQELGAQAFTHGSDVYFNSGKYDTGSRDGQRLLGHELTHVVQQGGAVQRSNDNTNLASPTTSFSVSQLAMSKAAGFAQLYGRPTSTSDGLLQRSTSNGVTVSRMQFSPKELPADGKTTSQATVNYSGRIAGGAKIIWSIVGPAFGSVVDANGVITPGAAVAPGADKSKIKVKAEDSNFPGANTHGFMTLWDVDYLQAKKDYPIFRSQVFQKDPFVGIDTKFAIQYAPATRRFDATVRVSFAFLDDQAGAKKWNNSSKKAFEQKFISVVQKRWSNQYQFENVREPQSIWKKLNPVQVRVNVKRDAKAPHFAITVHKKAWKSPDVAFVDPVNQTAEFGPGDDTPQPAFNPGTRVAELAALKGVTPSPILFAAGKFDIPAADKGKLEFMATYLRRINNPRFNIDITGHHQKVVHAPGATTKQKAVANHQATNLSRSRAQEVVKILKEGPAGSHPIKSRGIGDKGAAISPVWDKAVITSAIPAGWKNIQTTFEHEAGHMFGVDDEYPNPRVPIGGKASHYALTMQAFGKQYADLQAKTVADSASLMNGGNDIRPHHYVTFWDGLAQLTSAAAVPKMPFTHADWKFKGEH